MKIALVTGAAGGQGRAIVQRLGEAGYRVAACDVRRDELDTVTSESGALRIPMDVTDPSHWDAAVGATVQRFGGLSTLVNNAGVLHRAALAEETAEQFENSWRINCLGAFLGMRAALQHLRVADNAAIVNICSTGAIRPFPQHCAYGSAKWALRGLTQTAAAELAPARIRVNAVFPGPVATSMLEDGVQQRLAAVAMFGRLGRPAEIADAVTFLVSEQASFITGSELVVDGGQCLQIR